MRFKILPRVLRRGTPRKHCDVCEDLGTVNAPWALGRLRACDCGAFAAHPGTLAAMVLHTAQCDTLPCPFCCLKDTGV
jgi:hypothetical protein